jgi:hypothetical protein
MSRNHELKHIDNKFKLLKLNLLPAIIFLFVFLLLPNHALAHTGQEQAIGNYKVEISQNPLSPFVGENVQVTFTLENSAGKALEGLKGKIVIKETTIKLYEEKDTELGSKIIYEENGITDTSGNVGISYKFKKEGVYDVEYIWGNNENESAGQLIFVREPTSYFQPQELMKRIWLFIGIGFAVIMFTLLTTTLHPKR